MIENHVTMVLDALSTRKRVVLRPSPMMDPNDVYAASGGGLLGGSSAYGNPMN